MPQIALDGHLGSLALASLPLAGLFPHSGPRFLEFEMIPLKIPPPSVTPPMVSVLLFNNPPLPFSCQRPTILIKEAGTPILSIVVAGLELPHTN